jgi:hypothetical protein
VESNEPNLLEVFKGALSLKPDNVVEIDMELAREIQRDRIRALRAPLFPSNDLLLRDAHLNDDNRGLQVGRNVRDALRDAPNHTPIIAAKTLEELYAAVPKIITNNGRLI